MTNQPIKYLVAAALQEELNEFNYLLPDHHRATLNEIGFGTIQTAGKAIPVGTFSSNIMGMPFNAAKLMYVVQKYNPKVVLFIGTCARIQEQHAIGDVIIPSRAFSYESGKYNDGVFMPDLSAYPLDEHLRRSAEELNGGSKSAKLGYKVITDGDMASGSAVINDENKKKEIVEYSSRKLYAIDMEAYSIAVLNEILRSECHFLVIKSISDPAKDKSKAEAAGGKEIAKKNAAHFARELIVHLRV